MMGRGGEGRRFIIVRGGLTDRGTPATQRQSFLEDLKHKTNHDSPS